MCSCYKSVEQIIKHHLGSDGVEMALLNASTYYAHTPPNDRNVAPETLAEHLDRVLGYTQKLVDNHHLDEVINRLIEEYFLEVQFEVSPELVNITKEIFIKSIAYHDHGKVNENFQVVKMKNPHFQGKENQENGIESRHSTLSSFLFLSYTTDEIMHRFSGHKERSCLLGLAFLFSYGIYRHHSYALLDNFWDYILEESKRVEVFKRYLNQFSIPFKNSKSVDLITRERLEFYLGKGNAFGPYKESVALYQLLRLNYSLLTASDYLATYDYINGVEVTDLGTFDNHRIEELYSKIQTDDFLDEDNQKVNFNKKTFEELNTLSLEKPTEKSNENLNLLRQQMAAEAIRTLRKNKNAPIFYLEAPTGGGKTNISMLLALELLRYDSKINKVYYVFPFTTLIDQTFESIKTNLQLNEKEIVALHSKTSFANEISEDDQYGADKRNLVDKLFVNYPICLLSHIRFFDVLKSNRKETNYLLHRLANSIVIIDELQSYNPIHWDKVMYLLNQYAKLYNIRFILMSATLPKIGMLTIGDAKSDIISLLPNSKTEYFQNPNFSDRVKVDFSLVQHKITLKELASIVLEKSKEYAEQDYGESKPKGSVFTIVEFIIKSSTTLFEKKIDEISASFFDEVFVLSGTILHHRRREIINFIKRKENRTKKILLITTQVVEAGVDIDMDLGFKDTSLLDSDEQLAGRINRNVKKSHCQLFLFNYNNAGSIYSQDWRYQFPEKQLSSEEKEMILNTKDFDKFYQIVLDHKNTLEKRIEFIGIAEYIEAIRKLKFSTVHEEFQLIDQESLSCFVPIRVPICVEIDLVGQYESIFTPSDLDYLAEAGIYPDDEQKICGKQVFDFYLEMIQYPQSYQQRVIHLKKMQGILSKFVFSMFNSKKNKIRLKEFMDMEKSVYGFCYLSDWKKIYDETLGLKEWEFDAIDNLFI